MMLLYLAACLCVFPGCGKADTVKLNVQGSTTVSPVVSQAAERIQRERGWQIFVDTQGGSSGGISALGDGLADIGMVSKPVSGEDREKYPGVDFRTYAIGLDGVALVVSRPVWEAGVHALSRDEISAVYEGKIRNWKELGGPDAPIVFYNKEPGRGTWEVFADWCYGDHRRAPLISHPEVGANEEARTKVGSHSSAVTQLSFAWAEGAEGLRTLGIKLPSGEIVRPNVETIRTGHYPLVRTLYLVTDGEAKGPARVLIEYLLSEDGQELVRKNGYIPIR